jgi:hypothetical protein
MRLRHLPTFRQTRRHTAVSGNGYFRFAPNNLNPLDFDARFRTPDEASERLRGGRPVHRWIQRVQRFVLQVGEKFP